MKERVGEAEKENTDKMCFRVLTDEFQDVLSVPDMAMLTMITSSPSGIEVVFISCFILFYVTLCFAINMYFFHNQRK